MGFFSILGKPPYGGWFSYEKDFEEAVSKNYNIHILHFENLKRVRYTFLSMRGSKNIFRGGGGLGIRWIFDFAETYFGNFTV